MSSKASTFGETDIKRAVRAAENAGLTIGRLEIGKDGKISIVPREPGEKTVAPSSTKDNMGPQPEPWD
jgi:hypothetical protein